MRISDWSSDVCSSDLRNFSLLIGEATAKRIKKEVGVARPPADGVGRTIEIKGRDLVNGVPKEISANQGQIAAALAETVATIVSGVRLALENTAPDQIGSTSCRERVCPSV